MSSLIEKLDLFSTEQISDIEMLVDIYEQIPNEKKELFLMVFRAYMAGYKEGSECR